MSEEEVGIGAAEDDDLHVGIGLQVRQQGLQLDDRVGVDEVNRWIFECRDPEGRVASIDPELGHAASSLAVASNDVPIDGRRFDGTKVSKTPRCNTGALPTPSL
jgi:hypothetical protein